jgi:hypothetical protein
LRRSCIWGRASVSSGGIVRSNRVSRRALVRRIRPMTSRGSLLATCVGLAALVAIGAPIWFATTVYSGPAVWPGLVGNFSATLVAFLLALWVDRYYAGSQRKAEEEAERKKRSAQWQSKRQELTAAEARAEEARKEEITRRLRVLLKELDANRKAIGDVRQAFRTGVTMPPLHVGTWAAFAEPLGRIWANPELVGELAMFYARVAELQWRLHTLIEVSVPQLLRDAETLAMELETEAPPLLAQIQEEIDCPSAQAIGSIAYTGLGIRIVGEPVVGEVLTAVIHATTRRDDGAEAPQEAV